MKYSKSLLVLVLSITLVYVFAFGDYQNIRRDIYFKYNSKINFGYILGYIPKTYKQDYNENILISNDKFDLINVDYNKFPSYHNYIIFNDKITKNMVLLKDSDMIYTKIKGRKDLLSSQINLLCFNKLIDYKNLKKPDSISNFYCYLFSNFGTNYIRIRNQEELLKLVDNNNEALVNEKIPVFDLKTNLNYNKYLYYWYKKAGLFEFDFHYENSHIKSVSDRFLGYIGQEEN